MRILPNRIGYNGFNCTGIASHDIPPTACAVGSYQKLPYELLGAVPKVAWHNLSDIYNDSDFIAAAKKCGINYDPFDIDGFLIDLYSIFEKHPAAAALINKKCFTSEDPDLEEGYMTPVPQMHAPLLAQPGPQGGGGGAASPSSSSESSSWGRPLWWNGHCPDPWCPVDGVYKKRVSLATSCEDCIAALKSHYVTVHGYPPDYPKQLMFDEICQTDWGPDMSWCGWDCFDEVDPAGVPIEKFCRICCAEKAPESSSYSNSSFTLTDCDTTFKLVSRNAWSYVDIQSMYTLNQEFTFTANTPAACNMRYRIEAIAPDTTYFEIQPWTTCRSGFTDQIPWTVTPGWWSFRMSIMAGLCGCPPACGISRETYIKHNCVSCPAWVHPVRLCWPPLDYGGGWFC